MEHVRRPERRLRAGDRCARAVRAAADAASAHDHRALPPSAEGRAPDPLSLVYFVDGAVPTIFEIGEFVSSTVELTVHVRAIPANGWIAMRTRARHIGGGYHEEDAEIWDSEGKLVAQSRQLA